jgi:hypothetical protein
MKIAARVSLTAHALSIQRTPAQEPWSSHHLANSSTTNHACAVCTVLMDMLLMQLARFANNATHAQTSHLQTAQRPGLSTKKPASAMSVVCTVMVAMLRMLNAAPVRPVILAQDRQMTAADKVKCLILTLALVSTNIVQTFKFANQAKF